MSEMGVKFDIIILGWQKSHPFWFRSLRRTLVQNLSLEFLRRITAQNFFRTAIFVQNCYLGFSSELTYFHSVLPARSCFPVLPYFPAPSLCGTR